jgi:predicted N-acetyltransferase YhbS
VPACPGDHHLIHQFLLATFQEPSPGEFQAQLDDPHYDPQDRLLLRRDPQIIGHAYLTKREMHFGTLRLPVAGLADVAVLPEYQQRGCGAALLAAAEQRMKDDGAVLGVLRTTAPEFFLRRGWSVCLRHSYSVAAAREILSQLSEPARGQPSRRKSRAPRLNIRLWRHVEQAALTRLYEENTALSYGPLVRTEAYWRWLINRRAYDRIYVAINGPDKLALDDQLAPIVGYAAVREDRIVEMMVTPEHPGAARQLLARACRDAIEQDLHHVRFDGAPQDPLHSLLASAGGNRHYHEAEIGEVFLVKLFKPFDFLRCLQPQLRARACRANLTLPCELGFQLEDEKFGLSLSSDAVEVTTGRLKRSYLDVSRADLVQLMLGHVDVRAAVAAGRIGASTRVAVETASALWPRLPLWHPPLDDLRV